MGTGQGACFIASKIIKELKVMDMKFLIRESRLLFTPRGGAEHSRLRERKSTDIKRQRRTPPLPAVYTASQGLESFVMEFSLVLCQVLVKKDNTLADTRLLKPSLLAEVNQTSNAPPVIHS